MAEVCTNCGQAAKVERGTYRFKECGLDGVVLQGIEVIRCASCGNEDPVIPHVSELMRVLALAVVGKPYRLTGKEVRFLRKFLGMTGEEFARLLHVDKSTLSKWENGEDRVGEQSDRLIRLITLALGDGLREKIEEIIRRTFPRIHRTPRRVGITLNTERMSYQYA